MKYFFVKIGQFNIYVGIFGDFVCFNYCIFQIGGLDNLFVNYLFRIYREEVYFCFFKIKV